jgi:hypothetical protein
MRSQQPAVGHVLVGGIQAPGVPRRGEIPLGHVKTGEYPHNARHTLGFTLINGQHAPVRDRTAHQSGAQRISWTEVAGVLARPIAFSAASTRFTLFPITLMLIPLE